MYSSTIIFNELSRVQKPIPFPVRNETNKSSAFLQPILQVGLYSGLIYFGLDHFAFAEDSLTVKMEELYFGKFVKMAMWVLVGKGGWDTVNKAIKEDFDGAKKSFLQYIIIFAILLGLPTALREIDNLFGSWSA